jgi:hypothetical protein
VAGSPHHGRRSDLCARGQIVPGATNRASSLNRAVLQQCSQVMEGLLPLMLHLAIEHGPTTTGRRCAILRFTRRGRRKDVVRQADWQRRESMNACRIPSGKTTASQGG